MRKTEALRALLPLLLVGAVGADPGAEAPHGISNQNHQHNQSRRAGNWELFRRTAWEALDAAHRAVGAQSGSSNAFVVGSASSGRSIKNGRPVAFDVNRSDMDLAVTSNQLFEAGLRRLAGDPAMLEAALLETTNLRQALLGEAGARQPIGTEAARRMVEGMDAQTRQAFRARGLEMIRAQGAVPHTVTARVFPELGRWTRAFQPGGTLRALVSITKAEPVSIQVYSEQSFQQRFQNVRHKRPNDRLALEVRPVEGRAPRGFEPWVDPYYPKDAQPAPRPVAELGPPPSEPRLTRLEAEAMKESLWRQAEAVEQRGVRASAFLGQGAEAYNEAIAEQTRIFEAIEAIEKAMEGKESIRLSELFSRDSVVRVRELEGLRRRYEELERYRRELEARTRRTRNSPRVRGRG